MMETAGGGGGSSYQSEARSGVGPTTVGGATFEGINFGGLGGNGFSPLVLGIAAAAAIAIAFILKRK